MATYHIQTIAPDGTPSAELPLADGSGLEIRRAVNAASTAAWAAESAADSAPAWPYGTQIAVIRKTAGQPDERLFRGSVTSARHVFAGDAEAIQYTAHDAWWNLEREIFRAGRNIIGAGTVQAPRVVIFGPGADGRRVTAAFAVTAATAYAQAIGIPVQAGTIDAPVTPPASQLTDRSCAEIITAALRWQPDAAAWIDHATEPPTLYAARHAGLPATVLPVAGARVTVTARHDLALPGVEIAFETAGAVSSVQAAGDTAAPGCARMTIPLDSENSYTPGPEMEIKTVPLGDYRSPEWWRRMFPWLPPGASVTDARIDPDPPADCDNILIAGQVTQWMQDELDLTAGAFTVTCTVSGFEADGRTYTGKELSRAFTLTNARTKRYRGRHRASGWREAAPEGLAAAFLSAANALQHEGAVSTVEDECSAGRALIGRAVSLAGGRPEWETMAARVTQVTEHFDSGETQIAFGPQTHLGPQDLIELIRAARLRAGGQTVTITDAGDGEDEEEDADPFAPESNTASSPGQMSALELIEE